MGTDTEESGNDSDYVPKLVDRAGSEDDELNVPGAAPAPKRRKKAARSVGRGGRAGGIALSDEEEEEAEAAVAPTAQEEAAAAAQAEAAEAERQRQLDDLFAKELGGDVPRAPLAPPRAAPDALRVQGRPAPAPQSKPKPKPGAKKRKKGAMAVAAAAAAAAASRRRG